MRGVKQRSTSIYVQGICVECKKNKQTTKGLRKGRRIYSHCCSTCNKRKYNPKYIYLAKKGDRCEKCGFKPVHPIQLDVHHIDNNHSNNNESNLQTLCANCHRLCHVIRNEGAE